MQQTLFYNTNSESKILPIQEDETNSELFKRILDEEYLWDMRCWEKHRNQYTIEEVITHIKKWLNDDSRGDWSFNCGHCLYCIKVLLSRAVSFEEIAETVMKNNKVKYADEIGTWGNSIMEETEVEHLSDDQHISYCIDCHCLTEDGFCSYCDTFGINPDLNRDKNNICLQSIQ